MSTIRYSQNTKATPEEFIAAVLQSAASEA